MSFEKVSIDSIGNIYIPDSGNNRVRKISCNQPAITATSSNSLICSGETVNLTVTGASTYSWSSGNSGMIISVSPTTTTTYSVIGTNSVTGCRNTATVTQNVSECIGVKELIFQNNVSIFPNPFKNTINILASETMLPVQLFNSLGQIIYSSTIEYATTVIDLEKYANGAYFIRIGNVARKLIKE